jgi:hypothetical protein
MHPVHFVDQKTEYPLFSKDLTHLNFSFHEVSLEYKKSVSDLCHICTHLGTLISENNCATCIS